MHTPQRKIERQLSLPYKTSFIHTQIDDRSIINNKKTSVYRIKARFQEKFVDLQNVTNEKVDSLFNKAINDYNSHKKNEEKFSLMNLYQKYSEEGQELERETDEAFYSLYQALINELERNGYSENYAYEFEEEFIQLKKERELELLKKALHIL
jgi:hypothetical protein